MLGVLLIKQPSGHQLSALGIATEPQKVYKVKVGDTEWTIASKAFPDSDPRAMIGMINQQEPKEDRPSHTLRAGEQIILPSDAKIGVEAHPSGQLKP